MKFKHKVINKIAFAIHRAKLANHYIIKKDGRLNSPFKLVFFSGERDLDYLNSSLISVYKCWNELPDIYIISDGTPIEKIRTGLIKWPKKIEILSWEECAIDYKEKGNNNLYNYALNSLSGKKLVGILYCVEKFPVLYSDSDVLWLNSPKDFDLNFNLKPEIKMSQDVDFFYSKQMLESLNEEKCLNTIPYNSGVMLLSGEISSFPNWKSFCETLGTYNSSHWFEEQTAFAILSNYFNPNNFFSPTEVLIKIDDEYSLKYTKKEFPNILARHYVNVKTTAFWRDFIFIFFSRKNYKTNK